MSKIPILCPNCGSHEEVNQNEETFKCHHCFREFPLKESKTVLDSALRRRLDDAILKRNKCDFEDAALILEDLVSSHADVAEIYYQQLLTDYGVSFVSEDGGITEKPVLSSVQQESIFAKKEYRELQSLLANLPNQLNSYKTRLQQIEDLRLEALNTTKDIEEFDVFICYKRTMGEGALTQDSSTAGKLYRKFTAWGLNVFYAEETLYTRYAGRNFEPVIYRALSTAKLFVLVCATPSHPEFLIAPWVKNEWTRFKKRMDTQPDMKLRLLPVFDNGFTPELLPKALMKNTEGIKLDDQFDNIVYNLISSLMPKEKKSKFNEIKVKANKVGPLSITKEEVRKREFKSFKEKELDSSEKTDFTMALADMKINTSSKYKAAYKKLTHLTQTNTTNFEVNVAKLKCNFKIPYEESLVNADLWAVEDIDRMNKDFYAVIDGGGEGCDGVRKAMIQLLKKAFSGNPVKFANEIKKEESTFLAVANTIEDKKDLLSYAEEFEKPYFDLLDKREQYKKLKDDDILSIANKLFRRIYSNFEEKGAKKIFDLYRKSFLTLASKNSKNLVDKFINLALEINKLDVDCLWYRFCFDVDCLNADEYKLAGALDSSNFTNFEIDEEKDIDAKYQKANIYYFMIRAIQSGYKMDFTSRSAGSNYFNIILKAACIMTNKNQTRSLAKDIFDALASLTGSASANDKNTIALLLTIGDRLLIEKQFKDARRYYEQVLNIDDANCDARWGLVKCDVKKPTNYSLLTYRKSLNDLPSYSRLIAVHQESHSGEVNHYLAFYQAIEQIKGGHGKENKNLKNAFKQQNDRLMKADLPVDTSLADIIVSIGNGTLAQSATKPKIARAGSHYSSFLAGEKAALIVNISLIAISVVSAILFKPELAGLIVFVMSIVAAIMSRVGEGHSALTKNPYKKLLILFGILSILLFGGLISILYQDAITAARSAEEQTDFTVVVSSLYFVFIFAIVNLIVTLVRKCKSDSLDCDNSNAFTYYLLAIMAIAMVGLGAFNISLTLLEESTLFGIPIEINEGIWPWFILTIPYLSPVTALIVLRLVRGDGL